MRETTVAELRKHTKECFDLVERGEVIRVYRRGHPVAEIVPLREKVPSWREPIPRLTIAGLSLAEEILKDREDSGQ
jgi:antitoxin (DNA-binding transcriptional repressor) of toxin-antitoxin stability system